MDIIQEYIELTKICAATDYDDKKSVKLHNKSVDKMYDIVAKIESQQTTATIDDFAKLLDCSEINTNVWAALHILERISASKTIENKALDIIKKQTHGDTTDAMGFKIWLDNYKR